jgi:ABC-2 type transport system ATP-binding protein
VPRRLLAALSTLALLALGAPVAAAQEDRAGPDGPTVTHQAVTSFDGTVLATTLFLPAGASAAEPVPLVLRTHGWGGTRETSLGGGADVDPMAGTLAKLVDAGYAVLTWDSRGFGCSGGQVRIDDPDVEGRDASALIDWAVANAPIATDADGDPLVGMSGGSYAGGIQLATAAVDDRLDALAPEIAWSDLRYSLYGGEVVKQGWVALLYGLGTATGTALGLDPSCEAGPTADALDPAIHQGVSEYLTTGTTSSRTLDFFAKSSVAGFGDERPVTVPTLVLQGSVDTLFDLTDGWGIYEHVRDQGVDARFVAFCGGHVECPRSYADADDRAFLDDAILRWFAKHLRGEDVETGAPVTYRTNDGEWRDAATFTPGTAVSFSGAASGLPVVPVVDVPDVADTLGLLAGPPRGIPALPTTASKRATPGDPRAATFEVLRADDGPVELVGIPTVELTVSGVTTSLEAAMAPLGELVAELPRDQVGDVLIGSGGPLGAIAGGVVRGIGGDGGALGGVDGSVNLFVKLVHRELGEVVNLQEGAVRVDLTDGEVTVDVPMPGIAYSLPAGHHLDVEVATNSLMHATGRTPAIVDVEVRGDVPVLLAPEDDAGDPPGSGGTPGRSGDAPKGPPADRPGGPPQDRPGPPADRPAPPDRPEPRGGQPHDAATRAVAAAAVGDAGAGPSAMLVALSVVALAVAASGLARVVGRPDQPPRSSRRSR